MKSEVVNVLTVSHKRFDGRIWAKEIASLRSGGFKIHYTVADGQGDAIVDGVKIRDVGKMPEGFGFINRLRKMFRMVQNSGLGRGDLIHFHDGVFLPLSFFLWMKGCRVVYDVHEDYPQQILTTRFPLWLKTAMGMAFRVLEWWAGRLFKGMIAATPRIAERFPKNKTILIRNFPLLGELYRADAKPLYERPLNIVYVGGLTVVRGVREIIQATELASKRHSRVKLILAGEYSPSSLRDEMLEQPGYALTTELGWTDRNGVADLLNNARVGLVILHPTQSHLDSYPVKLFEYMSAGIPVIASDFPLWRSIVDGNECGLLVDPLDPSGIARAICWLLENPAAAMEMGRRGRNAAINAYDWKIEEEKLLKFYRCYLGGGEKV